MHQVMRYFEELGSLVDSRWRRKHYNETLFPQIAAEALQELPPSEHTVFTDIVDWAVTADRLPPQHDLAARFGDPPLTVYTGREFRIEVLFWIEGLPGIHCHAFSGAFHVLHGASLHTLWDFLPTTPIETRLIIGQISLRTAELLTKGDSRAIEAGAKMFHATFHTERPSVTVVVRTISEINHLPQYVLYPPSVAVDPDNEIPHVKRQVQILRMLLLSERRYEYQCLMRVLIESKDPYSVYKFLQATYPMVEDEEDRQALEGLLEWRFLELGRALIGSLKSEQYGNKLMALFTAVNDSELKFFLALLRNVPLKGLALKLIRQKYPRYEPVEFVLGCIDKLSRLGALGFKVHPSWLVTLRQLLSEGEAAVPLTIEGKTNATAIYSSGQFDCALTDAIREFWLLRPLLAKSSQIGI